MNASFPQFTILAFDCIFTQKNIINVKTPKYFIARSYFFSQISQTSFYFVWSQNNCAVICDWKPKSIKMLDVGGLKVLSVVFRCVKTCPQSLLNKLAVFNQAQSLFARQSRSANCFLTFEETLNPHHDFSAVHLNPTVNVIVTGLIIMQQFLRHLVLNWVIGLR